MRNLIIAAIILRIFLAAILYHPDLKTIYKDASYLRPGISQGYTNAYLNKNPLPYPPPIYLIYNLHQKIDGWMFSSYFNTWMDDWGTQHVQSHPYIFRDLLVMKLPIFVFDFLALFILLQFFEKDKRKMVAAIWLFNPFSIYAMYAFGQFDIMPTALLLGAALLFKKEKYTFSYMLLGLAGGFKIFPILLLPFFVVLDKRGVVKKLISFFVGILFFSLSFLPIITSKIALQSVFLSNLTSGIFKASVGIGGGKELPFFLCFYLIFLLLLGFGYIRKLQIEAVILIVIGALFAVSHFHPQWFLWLMPFLLICLVEGLVGLKETVLLMLCYMLLVLLIADNFVGLGLLKAVNNAFDTVPSIKFVLDKFGVGSQVQNFSAALFFAFMTIVLLQAAGILKAKGVLIWERVKLLKIISVWVVSLVVLFVVAHVPVYVFGHYIDSEQMNVNDQFLLTNKIKITQQFKVKNNNFTGMILRLKNINLRNHNDLIFEIQNEQGEKIEDIILNGGAIGDDFDTKINLKKPIADSAGKTYYLVITSPQADTGSEIIVPFDDKTGFNGLKVNSLDRVGNLSYTIFYNPGNFLQNVGYSLGNIVHKI